MGIKETTQAMESGGERGTYHEKHMHSSQFLPIPRIPASFVCVRERQVLWEAAKEKGQSHVQEESSLRARGGGTCADCSRRPGTSVGGGFGGGESCDQIDVR